MTLKLYHAWLVCAMLLRAPVNSFSFSVIRTYFANDNNCSSLQHNSLVLFSSFGNITMDCLITIFFLVQSTAQQL
uniref:Uncharacterized protein n=1 Tax=Arundo donax TaxID=35708 RepID=A0A0A9C2R5_ARUDO